MYNQGSWDGFGHMGNSMMGGGYMFLILILIIAFLAFAFFKRNTNNYSKPKAEDALEILKKRFANSEISEEEYLSKSKILKG